MMHVAVLELDPTTQAASESRNAAIVDYAPPGDETGFAELAHNDLDVSPEPTSIHPLNTSFTELMVYQKALDTSTRVNSIPSNFDASRTLPNLPLWLAISAASYYVFRRLRGTREDYDPKVEVASRDKAMQMRQRTRRLRRNRRAVGGQNTVQESAKPMCHQFSLEELEGNVLELTSEIVWGSYQAAGATLPTTPVVHDANERVLLKVLMIPALWELIFAGSVIPPALTPYGQLKLTAGARIVVCKSERASRGRDFGIEELVDGVYVVGDTSEGCPTLAAAVDVVSTWLAEREEVRAWEQGTELGIVWACPPHA